MSSGAQGTAIRDDDATTAVSSHPQNRSRAAASSNEPAEHPETSRSNSEQVSTHPEQPNRDQTVLAVLLLVALSVLCWNYCQLTSRRPDGLSIIRSSSEIGYRIDINSATWIELSQLEGIGPVIARRIVDDRERRGPFASIDDLQRVRGIGPRTVERNRRWMQAAPPERP